ncbi:hypothetical protein [Dictyobacter alpinus]|uniref:hypothetical protein n=1 Tax=Dictyobacter alpinus TaxID=2014873 RepID=UPI000F84BACD|nr:hypothetical protein [Dictyobacter alpinus]
MIPTIINQAAPVAPPAYHRVQGRSGPAMHIDALTLVSTLHLLVLCRLAVRLAYRRLLLLFQDSQELILHHNERRLR